MSQQTSQLTSRIVRQGDTLERLALQYMGSAEDWLQLAILNNLDYPYIVDDSSFVRNVKATGSVTFTRTAASTGDVVIPTGSSVSVPATTNAPARFYTTDASVTIPDGTPTATVTVTAGVAGENSNAPGLTVTALGFTVTNLASVTNLAAITGGVILNVKLPGDTIALFTSDTGATASVGLDISGFGKGTDAFFKALLGTDLALTNDGDLSTDSRGGLATVSGIPNLVAALKRRFATSLGWYSYYPYYGSGIEKAIGQKALPYWLQWARLEVERTVRTDPRVADVQGITAKFTAGALTITLDVLIIGQQTPQNVVLSFRPTTGGA